MQRDSPLCLRFLSFPPFSTFHKILNHENPKLVSISILLCHILEKAAAQFSSLFILPCPRVLHSSQTLKTLSSVCFLQAAALLANFFSIVQRSSVCYTIQVDLCSKQRCRLRYHLKTVFKNAGTVGYLQSQTLKQIIPWNVF